MTHRVKPSRSAARSPLVLTAFLAAGCGPGGPFSIRFGGGPPSVPKFVQEIPATTSLPREPDTSAVVFIRPSSESPGFMPSILDERGNFLGMSLASSIFTVTVRPGDHVFVLCDDESVPLRARLEPGKRYYVHLVAEGIIFSPDLNLVPIRPGTASWNNLAAWGASLKRIVSDEKAGQEDLGEQASVCVQSALEQLKTYDAPTLKARTLGPTDGH